MKVRLVRGRYKNILKGQVQTPEQIYKIFKSIKDEAQETLIGVYLNDKLEAIAYNVLYVGTQRYVIASPREIFGYGFVIMATFFILIHNHPKGNPDPSCIDRETIKRLKKYASIMKMPMLDFIIVGDLSNAEKKNYWSMFEVKNGKKYSQGYSFYKAFF